MVTWTHHDLCNALPDCPYGRGGCTCHYCGKCETVFHGPWKDHDCMSSYFMTPLGGLTLIKEGTLLPCPVCGGRRTTLTEMHRVGCTFDSTVPTPRPLFDTPAPTFWVYRVEFRVKLKYMDGHEGWSDWTPLSRATLKSYYLTERSASKALARLERTGRVFHGREYRVGRVERSDRHPAGRR